MSLLERSRTTQQQATTTDVPDKKRMKILLCRHGQSVHNELYHQTKRDPMVQDAPLTSLGKEQALKLNQTLKAKYRVRAAVSSPLTRAMQTCKLAILGEEGAIVGHHDDANQSSTSRSIPVFVTPIVTEQLLDSCDVGRELHEIEKEFLEHKFDFSHVKQRCTELGHNCWWYIPPPSDDTKDTTEDASKHSVPLELHKKIKTSSSVYYEHWMEKRWAEPDIETRQRSRMLLKWITEHPHISRIEDRGGSDEDDNREEAIAVFGHADIFSHISGYIMKNCEVFEVTPDIVEKLLAEHHYMST